MVRFSPAPLLALTCMAAMGDVRVANPGFEQDGAAIQGVGYIGQGNKLTGWRTSFPMGVGRNAASSAFFDNGLVPEGRCVAVLQNPNWIEQIAPGAEAGRIYRLSVRANGRAADGAKRAGLRVEVNGTALINEVAVAPVGAGQPYHAYAAWFRAGSGSLHLRLSQTSAEEGVSVLIDDVRIEAAPAGVAPPSAVVDVNPALVASEPMVRPESDLTDVQWIWTREVRQAQDNAPVGVRNFRRPFTVPAGARVRRATLTFTSDNSAQAFVNGSRCAWNDDHSRLFRADVTHLVRSGANALAFRVANLGDKPNPAGLVAVLQVDLTSGRPLRITTGAGWLCSASAPAGWSSPGFSASGWSRAVALGEFGGAPWGWVGPPSPRVPHAFPDFIVPGHAREMGLLRRLFALHLPGARPVSTLWDVWLPMSSLWAAAEADLSRPRSPEQWSRALEAGRRISAEGYVSTHQHRGYGHSEGWPIPLYMQTGGVGFHFSTAGDVFATWVPRKARPEEWRTEGLRRGALEPDRGWNLTLDAGLGSVTSPAFDIPMAAAPMARLEWAPGRVRSGTVQWATADRPGFDDARSMAFDAPVEAPAMGYTNVLLSRCPAWSDEGRMTRLRVTFRGDPGDRLVLKELITPADTRHNVNNPAYLIGCADYVEWTGDDAFLKRNIERMRLAMRFAISEFRLRESHCVDMTWYGHDGRGGYTRDASGKKLPRYAGGVGCNYWDLLPSGGKDTLATVYCHEALRRMAALERAAAAHPEWAVPSSGALDPADLEALAAAMKAEMNASLWNAETGRFPASVDRDGLFHDYGYTYVNCEAVAYGVASPQRARSIYEWLDGKRTVPGDTSQGADIYRWRFGPRASTRRNLDWYSGMWDPENVPFGDQVQDGGAVLGFSYHDLLARLKTLGPDDAWRRLQQLLAWFADVQAEGGYRAYYGKGGRGTMQGGGPPGGLGMDNEFFESVLVPQIMLYGFMGARPSLAGLTLNPTLPASWPSLTVTRVRCHGLTLSLHATRTRIRVTALGGDAAAALRILPGSSAWRVKGRRGAVQHPGDVVELVRAGGR